MDALLNEFAKDGPTTDPVSNSVVKPTPPKPNMMGGPKMMGMGGGPRTSVKMGGGSIKKAMGMAVAGKVSKISLGNDFFNDLDDNVLFSPSEAVTQK